MARKSDGHSKYIKEKQGELFGEFETPHQKRGGRPFKRNIAFRKKVAFDLSYENIVLFFIIFIMLLVVFFSLGVEKGKRIEGTPAAGHIAKESEEKPALKDKGKTALSQIDEEKTGEIEREDEPVAKKEIAIPAKSYTVQVVSFKKSRDVKAKKEVARLKKEGYKSFIIPSEEWLQVCVGRYADKKEARGDIEALKKKYPTCYFRKIE